jgi:hypothetical protein
MAVIFILTKSHKDKKGNQIVYNNQKIFII